MVIEWESNYDCLISAERKRPGSGSLYLKGGQRVLALMFIVRLERGSRMSGECAMTRRPLCTNS